MVLWLSILALVIAVSSTAIGYFVFRSQVDPEVVVYTSPDIRRPSIILLVIENIGKGGAQNVSFEMSKPLPKNAFGLTEEKASPFVAMDEGAFITGIPFLEPGGKRTFTWGQHAGLKKHIGTEGIVVTVNYEHRHFGLPITFRKTGAFSLEMQSYDHTDASDSNWDKKIANHLGDISRTLRDLGK